ncbi:MAG: AAA family ATPase [Planctomycetaceae bacterium]
MKLVEIRVDRCGVWRDLSLPLQAEGPNVFYGPNEAGKSTLVRFIRGVLFGFDERGASESDGDVPKSACAGSLLIDDPALGQHLVHRSAPAGLRGTVSLLGEESDRPAEDLLRDLLDGIDQGLFNTLFSIDLRELMELRALSGEEAARHIYGLSLGPDGRRLLDVTTRAQTERHRLVNPFQHDGELVRLFEQQDQLLAELRGLDEQRRRHAALCASRDRLKLEIADLLKRQAGVREQLRGHMFLQQAWAPWHQGREMAARLRELPVIRGFPERGVERLERIAQQLRQGEFKRDELLTEIGGLRRELRSTTHQAALASHAATMRSFVEQRGWLVELHERYGAAQSAANDAEGGLATRLEALGADWNEERLAGLDLSPAAWQRLAGARQSLLAAQARRGALRRKVRRLSVAHRELRDSLAECLHKLEGASIEAALAQARERQRQAQHLTKLQIREAELSQRQFNLHEEHSRLSQHLALPTWVHVVLAVFFFMGIVLAGWGAITGVATSGIVGAIYMLLGITCGGLAWGLRAQHAGDARQRLAEADQQLAAALLELREVRGAIHRLVEGDRSGIAPVAGSASISARPTDIPDSAEYLRLAAERVAELADLARHERSLRALRGRLRMAQQKLEIARREARTAKEAWCGRLQEHGLAAELSPRLALDIWQRLVESDDCRRRCARRRDEVRSLEAVWDGFRRRIAAFAQTVPELDFDEERPLAALDLWERRLAVLSRERTKRKELKSRLKSLLAETTALQSQLDEWKLECNALLVQGGAATGAEFAERARLVGMRETLEAQSQVLRRELDAVCAGHQDLALVEVDLLNYDAESNSACISTLEQEATDLDRDLHEARERLAADERNKEALEQDRTSARVRCDLAQVHERLRAAACEWAAIETAAQSASSLRNEYERRHQPAALVRASQLLSRLTCGRFRRVWTPLGERRLVVEDEGGRQLNPAILSHGTREQLFLAVRLAVVDELARQGVSLPVILDDVFVNFDEHRAEAAVETLCEFASSGRQVIVLTCHPHLVRLFADHGIEVTRLPAHAPEVEVRDGQRRAG